MCFFGIFDILVAITACLILITGSSLHITFKSPKEVREEKEAEAKNVQ